MDRPAISADQVVGRVCNTPEYIGVNLNSAGRELPDNAPLFATPQPSPAGLILDTEKLRLMLRDEFGARGRRDMAVARAVQAWYLTQNPELVLLVDQPDLYGIVAGIGAPTPQPPASIMAPLGGPFSAQANIWKDQ